MALTTKPADAAARPATTATPTAPPASIVDDAAAAAAVVVAPTVPAAAPAWTAPATPAAADAVASMTASLSAAAKRAWGPASVAASAVNLNRDEFAKASVPMQKARLGELKVEKAALGTKIQDRAAALDARWQRSSVSTKTEALRQYHERSKLLDPVARKELSGLVKKSDEAQGKIDKLRENSDLLCKPQSQSCTPEETKAANELAGKLADARDAQAVVVERATVAIDQKGLKIDRLAVTEDVIDPGGEARGGIGQSLLELVEEYTDVSSMIDWIVTKFADNMKEQREEFDKGRELDRKSDDEERARYKADDKRSALRAGERRKEVVKELSKAMERAAEIKLEQWGTRA